MRLALVGVCCFVVVVAGCGSAQSSPSGERQATSSTTNEDSGPARLLEFGGEGTSVVWLTEDKVDPRPLKELYSVFVRRQTRPEAEVASKQATYPACPPVSAREDDFGDPGKPILGGTRILLRDLGVQDYDLVAVPTTRDKVAFGLFPEGSWSCGAVPVPDGWTLAAEVHKHSALVYGLAGDGVVSVDLVVNSTEHRARLGENGFALEIREPTGKILEKIVLRREDGSVTEIPSD